MRFPFGRRLLPGFVLLFPLLVFATRSGAAEPEWATRFMIGAWVGADSDRLDGLARVANAGFDYVHTGGAPTPDAGRAVLGRLAQLGDSIPDFRLQAVLHYTMPVADRGRIGHNDDPAGNAAAIDRSIQPAFGLNTPQTLGWLLQDEPCERARVEALAAEARRIQALPAAKGKLPYVNLYPLPAPGEAECMRLDFGDDRLAAYAAYLRTWTRAFPDTAHPLPVLSVDRYPFATSFDPDPDYYATLGLVRDAVNEVSRPGRRMPWWMVIQISPFRAPGAQRFFEPFGLPQIRLQAYAAAAYGASGVGYWATFSIVDRPTGKLFGGGLLEEDARPGPRYDGIRRLNAELHALGPTLMQLECVRVDHVSTTGQRDLEHERWGATPTPGAPARVLAGIDGTGRVSALVATLRDRLRGTEYLFVVNKDLRTARNFTIRLAAPVRRIDRISRETGKLVPVAGTSAFEVAALPAGTGDLFRLTR